MDPKIWGPIHWAYLFSTALGYPLEPGIDDQYAYSRFFLLLSKTLPCESCRENYENHYRNVPINFYLYSRKALLNWVLILHNEVNKTLGKPSISLEEAISKYLGRDVINSGVYAQCIETQPSYKVPTAPDISDWVRQIPVGRNNCPTTTPIQVVEGFNFEAALEGKNIAIIGLVLLVIYLLLSRVRR